MLNWDYPSGEKDTKGVIRSVNRRLTGNTMAKIVNEL